jgi:drug/metabolite transporter (DMT)-like permease
MPRAAMPHEHAAHSLRQAVPLFLLAGFCLTSLDTTAKWLVRDHSLFLVVWARCAGQMLVVTPFAWHRAGPGFWRTRRLRLQLIRSALLLTATVCFFGALRFLPLAEASAITFLAPIIIVMLSGPMLGERPGRWRWITSLTGFAGMLILLRPGSAVFHPAVVLVLGMALANALYQILTRKLQDEDVHTTLFYSALVGTVGLTLLLPWGLSEGLPTWQDGALFLLLGLLAGLGHRFVIGAYLLAPASLLTPFAYLQMLWATAYGYVIFGQLPDGWSALGMAVIVGSGVMLAWHERRRSRMPFAREA